MGKKDEIICVSVIIGLFGLGFAASCDVTIGIIILGLAFVYYFISISKLKNESETKKLNNFMPYSFMEETRKNENNAKRNYLKAVYLFKNLIKNFSYQTIEISTSECVFLIENKLVVYIGLKINRHYITKFTNEYEIIHHVKIEELLHNDVFKFNGAAFSRNFDYQYNIYIRKFSGLLNKQAWSIDENGNPDASEFDRINHLLPNLNLKKRYDEWVGVLYYFIVFEFVHLGKNQFDVKYTTNTNISNYVHSYYCKNDKYIFYSDCAYFYFSKYIKEETTLQNEVDAIIVSLNNGEYNDAKRYHYIHPDNKWKSEQIVYECCKNIYGENNVIYQYHPHFLGQMSYDVFIINKNIAIEYQGKQHFEPVEFFGGQEQFKQQVKRDKLKKRLSDENGIKLVYINYDETITEDLIKDKIENAAI